MHTCPDCKKDLPIDAFGRAKWRKEGISYRCKACNARRMKEWGAQNPEKRRAASRSTYRRWRDRNPIIAKSPFITSDGRLCRTCGIRKPDEEFVFDERGPNGRGWRCKACAKIAAAKWVKENPLYRQYQYGISGAEVAALFDMQNGCCAICKKAISLNGNRKHGSAGHVDHDHKSGTVRGLLCPPCNTALGGFKDNIVSLKAAIAYLEAFSNG